MDKFLQNWDSVGISRIIDEIDEIERNHGRNQAEVVGFSSFGGSNGCSSCPSWASASIGSIVTSCKLEQAVLWKKKKKKKDNIG